MFSGYRSLAVAALLAGVVFAQGPRYKLGRAATEKDAQEKDHFVSPDGKGLPPGKGTAVEGRDVYKRRCERCHGAQGEGKDEAALVGGKGTLATPKPLKTVGSYWPYATTLVDYVNRAMPFDNPGLLTNDQVYAVTALVLHWNGIIGERDVMDAAALAKVRMPNRDGFVADARPDGGKKARK